MSFIKKRVPSFPACMNLLSITNFSAGMRGWDIIAIEERIHPDVCIKNDAPSFSAGMTPRNITNFPADDLGWYVKAIEKYGYVGFYIEKGACTSTGCKLDDHYTFMAVGDYYMPEFWKVFDELKAKYPVCPEVGIQDVMFGPSAECQKLIDEMRRRMHADACEN